MAVLQVIQEGIHPWYGPLLRYSANDSQHASLHKAWLPSAAKDAHETHLELSQVLHWRASCLLQVPQLRLGYLAVGHHPVPNLYSSITVCFLCLDHGHYIALFQSNDCGRNAQAVLCEVGHHPGLCAEDANTGLTLPGLHNKFAGHT